MDKYSVLDLIGEGSFGRVFRGKDKQTGEIVALKLIPKIGHSEKDIKSLRCECKIQKELKHPNIVRMIDAFETDNEVISVAEYVPGELFRLFDQYKTETVGQRRLPEHRVQEIAGDLVSALHYLHSNRVLHRDIKPQNILLDTQGTAKLCDFGFARNLGLDTMVLTSIKGTPLYMAPELIEEKPYDHTADIWSLGCIVYELLVGVPPFSTTSLFQLIKKIRYESVQWPGHLSSMARDWLQGTLEKDCRRRLSWPDLHNHPFVSNHVNVTGSVPNVINTLPPLTDTLTASQELAKEIQRQDKAKLLPGGSQTLIKVAQKHELQKQQIAAAQKAIMERKPGLSKKNILDKRRFSDGSHLQAGNSPGGKGMLLGRHYASHMSRRMSEFGQQLSMLPHLAQAQYLAPVQPLQPIQPSYKNHQPPPIPVQNNILSPIQKLHPQVHPPVPTYSQPASHVVPVPTNGFNNVKSMAPHLIPSKPKMASSINLSTSINPPPVQFTQTVQQEGLVMPEPVRNINKTGQIELNEVVEKLKVLATTDQDTNDVSVDSNETLKNENDEDKQIIGVDDSTLENDEWCEFLDGQLEEMMEEFEGDGHLDCVDNPNFLGLIVGPLKNINVNLLVLQKISNVLMLPMSTENKNNSTYSKLLKSYYDKNIINLLLVALKISTSNKEDVLELDDISELEVAWSKLISLLTHLVHCEDMFTDQISSLDCDTFIMLLSAANTEIICDTLSFLSKIFSLRKDLNKSFIENIYKEVTEELLLEETNETVLIKICYILGLIARNFPFCIENKEVLLKKVLKCCAEQKNLKKPVNFVKYFLE